MHMRPSSLESQQLGLAVYTFPRGWRVVARNSIDAIPSAPRRNHLQLLLKCPISWIVELSRLSVCYMQE